MKLATTALALPFIIAPAAQAQTSTELPPVNVNAPRENIAPGMLGPSSLPLNEAPAQVSTVPAQTLREPGTHNLSTALTHVPSVSENYAIIGYYENFTIRGYTLDLGSAYRINGFIVPGELHTGLDNKQRVEVLQGVGTLASGATGPGGIVNYVTKRPQDVRAARFELNQQGGSYAGIDLGFTGDRSIGLRINAAHEELRPYADKATGTRNFLSIALDARPTDALTLTADLEYQRRSQFAVPGYQLLGGTTLPSGVNPATNINQQPWTRPVQNEASFVGLRADWRPAAEWRLNAGVGQGIARIADNLAFPFGCNTAPTQYFCANGDYILYDYHSNERRQSTQLDATLSRQWQSGTLRQHASLGVDRIERKVSQRDFYSATNFDALGNAQSGNLYNVAVPLAAPPTASTNLLPTRALQTSLVLADTLEWRQWRLHLGLRITRVQQETPGAGKQPGATHRLPQVALTHSFTPQSRAYLSYAQGLEFGSEAPTTAENSGALLAPRRTRQIEAGYKQEWTGGATLSAALFHMNRPYDFIEPVGTSFAGLGQFRRAGDQVHVGAEVSAAFPITSQLRLQAAATLLRARAENTGIAAYEGVQVQNVPRLRSAVTGTYNFADAPGLSSSLTWLYTGARNARADGAASVPGYHRLDAGIAYVTRIAGQKATWQLKVTNLTDKRYWRDVGHAYSADLLFPGAPRQVFAGVVIENP